MLPLLAVGDLTAIYNELRSIHLRTLNKVGGGWLRCWEVGGLSCAWGAPGTHNHWLPQVGHVPATPRVCLQERAEIIAQHWLQEGRVPTPRQVRGAMPLGCGTAGKQRHGQGVRLAWWSSLWRAAALVAQTRDTPCPAALPACLQVSEEERFVLPPHIEGRHGGWRSRHCCRSPGCPCMLRPRSGALYHAPEAHRPPSSPSSVQWAPCRSPSPRWIARCAAQPTWTCLSGRPGERLGCWLNGRAGLWEPSAL